MRHILLNFCPPDDRIPKRSLFSSATLNPRRFCILCAGWTGRKYRAFPEKSVKIPINTEISALFSKITEISSPGSALRSIYPDHCAKAFDFPLHKSIPSSVSRNAASWSISQFSKNGFRINKCQSCHLPKERAPG
ncbi:unnamed protein product, partial [Vitis vinifera]